jgi:hypothetical protein
MTWKTQQDPQMKEGAQVHVCLSREAYILDLPDFNS